MQESSGGASAAFLLTHLLELSCQQLWCPPCRVFSVERGPEGKRSFIVTSYAKFWERYRDMLPQHRHYYEIIRESRPCHLYFGERKMPFAVFFCIPCLQGHWGKASDLRH